MKDGQREFAVHLGRAQIDAMFARQAAHPLDDSEFLPLLEVMLTVYEKILPDAVVADELWITLLPFMTVCAGKRSRPGALPITGN